MKYKLLALDIDGTIVKEHTNTASKAVIEAIQKAKEKLSISLITGRAWLDQKIIIDLLDLPSNYHVSENGAKVINPSGSLEYSRCIVYEEIDAILSLAKTLHHDVAFCLNGKWEPYTALEKTSQISTISFISANRQLGVQISQTLPETGREYSVSVGSHWSESEWAVTMISHQHASKGNGLAYVQRKLGILPEE